MLLYVMGHRAQRGPSRNARSKAEVRDYTTELLGAALFMGGWCVLRLLISRDASHGVDATLAVSCLVLGALAVRHCISTMRAGERARRLDRAQDGAFARK